MTYFRNFGTRGHSTLQGNITNLTNYTLNILLIIYYYYYYYYYYYPYNNNYYYYYFESLGGVQVGRFGGVSFLSFIQIQHNILS